MRRRTGLSPAPIEFFPRQFYLVVIQERTTCSIHRAKDEAINSISISERHLFPRTSGIRFVSLQEHLLPRTSNSSEFVLGIHQTIRFNSFLTNILNTAISPPLVNNPTLRRSEGIDPKTVNYFFLRRRHLREEIQAVHLICRWRLLYLQLPPHEALAPFEHLPYVFSSFLSQSNSYDPPNLFVSLTGIAKGLEKELLVPLNATSSTLGSTWDAITTQSNHERNIWTISRRFIVYNKFTANQADNGKGQMNANAKQCDSSTDLEDTISALKRGRVSLVIALSKMHCDTSIFAERGLEMLDISSATASPSTISLGDKLAPPDDALVNRFLDACEGTEDIIAVNASTDFSFVSAATCIGCYLMKHENFTSQEAIGWLQFCLPVKIPMEWELFLGQLQSQMWLEGERFRRVRQVSRSDEITNSPTTDPMHINIGKISLGRVSLLGTRDRDKHHIDSYTPSIPVSSCLSSRSQESEQSPTAATTIAQLKRRPLTQGSVGSRRFHRSTDGTSVRADFALMHKFLHQTPPTSTRSPSTSTNSPTPSIHTVPSRPKASGRSPDGTPANCTEALA